MSHQVRENVCHEFVLTKRLTHCWAPSCISKAAASRSAQVAFRKLSTLAAVKTSCVTFSSVAG